MSKVKVNDSILNIVENVIVRNITAWKADMKRVDFQSNAITWGQLKSELEDKGFTFNNTRVSEGYTSIDLVNDDAVLPVNISRKGTVTNDLVIIMSPQQSIKSGNMNYKELKEAIKNASDAVRDQIKAIEGNYTQMSTEKLQQVYDKYIRVSNKSVTSTKSASKTTSKIAIDSPVMSYKEMKETIKNLVADNVFAKSYFGNYTQLSSAKMAELLGSWDGMKTSTKRESCDKCVKETEPTVNTTKVKNVFTINRDEYNKGIEHIIHGVNKLTNAVMQDSDGISDNELADLVRKMR